MKNRIYSEGFTKYKSVKYRDHNNIYKPIVKSTPSYVGNLTINGERFANSEIDYTEKHPKFSMESTYNTKEVYEEEFNNLLYYQHKSEMKIVIDETDEKISYKVFDSIKEKGVGKPWYKVIKNVEYVTVNKKTGDVYFGFIHNYTKKRSAHKKVRRNYFANQPFNAFLSRTKYLLDRFKVDSVKYVVESSNLFLSKLFDITPNLDKNDNLFKFYLDKRQIKYPNNFNIYADKIVGPLFKKELKKNGNKIVDTYMSLHGLTGKKLKKHLHEVNHINCSLYIDAEILFGKNILHNDDEALRLILENKRCYLFSESVRSLKEITSDTELKRIFSIFKLVLDNNINIYTFNDHIAMYLKLHMLGETNTVWRSDGKSIVEFNQEHLQWSEIIDLYRNGNKTRVYPEYFFEEIEKPINGYYPKILTTTDEYNEESRTQSNCVRGYVGRAKSFIISIRYGSNSSPIRATVEYSISKEKDNIIAKRVQSLGRFNERLSEEWNDILFNLDKIVISCFSDNRYESMELIVELPNKTLKKTNSEFDEHGQCKWSDEFQGQFLF